MDQWIETEGARDNLSYPLLDRVHGEHAKMLDHAEDDRILDVGCGRNPLNMYVQSGRVVGIDPDRRLVAEAKEKLVHGEVCCGVGDELAFEDGSFDLVFMRGVVHHLSSEQRGETFDEIRRVLKPGGELHVLEPDPESRFRSLVWRVSERLGYEHEESPHIDSSGYVDASGLRDLCTGAGLEVTTQSTAGSLLSPLAFVYPYKFGVNSLEALYRWTPAAWWSRTVATKV